MSLAFDLLEDRRRSAARDAAWRKSRAQLLKAAAASLALAAFALLCAYTAHGFLSP